VKLRKATISFVTFVRLSVCLSVRMGQLGSHWTNFCEIWYLKDPPPPKSVEKFQVPLKSDKNNGYFTLRPIYIFFYFHRAMHRNIISIVKPTGCTNVSNLFILEWHSTCFGRSFRPSPGVQHCTYSNQTDTAVCLLASRQQYLFDKCLLLYVQSWTADDGRKDRPKHVECHSKIK